MANAVTVLIEKVSAVLGYVFASEAIVRLPFLLSFAGASMMTVVAREIWKKIGIGKKFPAKDL